MEVVKIRKIDNRIAMKKGEWKSFLPNTMKTICDQMSMSGVDFLYRSLIDLEKIFEKSGDNGRPIYSLQFHTEDKEINKKHIYLNSVLYFNEKSEFKVYISVFKLFDDKPLRTLEIRKLNLLSNLTLKQILSYINDNNKTLLVGDFRYTSKDMKQYLKSKNIL